MPITHTRPMLAVLSLVALTACAANPASTVYTSTTGSSGDSDSATGDTDAASDSTDKPVQNPRVSLQTSLGVIIVELDATKAPISTANFLSYVDKGHYPGLLFHRVIPNFMVQGGGIKPDGTQKKTDAPIKNEADNGLHNDRGTLAMARTAVKDSATSQFFVNLVDNDFLNHGDPKASGFGYTVFGKVVTGMDVVDKIAAMPTGSGDRPVQDVLIEQATKL